MARNLLKLWPALRTFADHRGVEPTNNHAERALRGAVIYRKLSLGSQSDDGASSGSCRSTPPAGCNADRYTTTSSRRSPPTPATSPRRSSPDRASGLNAYVFPLLSGQIAHLQLWQWPQYVAMFGLGIVAAQRRWLDPVPDQIRRRCGLAAVLGILGVLLVGGAVLATGLEPDVLFERRFHWAPLAWIAGSGGRSG